MERDVFYSAAKSFKFGGETETEPVSLSLGSFFALARTSFQPGPECRRIISFVVFPRFFAYLLRLWNGLPARLQGRRLPS